MNNRGVRRNRLAPFSLPGPYRVHSESGKVGIIEPMNITFQRAIDRFVGVPVCATFSLVARLRGEPGSLSPPRKVLVILLSEMGSLVLARPMFERLKQQYPEASIHALVFAKNREALDLLGVIPEENVLTLDDRSIGVFATGVVRVLRALRTFRFDVVIDCELFARVSSAFSYLSGAPIRVGFHPHTQEGLYRGSFINRAVLYNPYRHLSLQFLTMADAIESDTVPRAKHPSTPDPVAPSPMVFPAGELQQVAARFHADFPSITGRRLVLVYPSGGLLPIRAWPLDNYRRFCDEILKDGHALGVIGLESDKPLARAIVEHCRSPFCVDLTGYTGSVRHLIALFHQGSLLVTNDGGPGHFAALAPIPAIIFFGPETPVLYGPLSRSAFCFTLSLPCSPCLTAYNHRTSPCDGDNQCLKRITVEQVVAKARDMLGSSD